MAMHNHQQESSYRTENMSGTKRSFEKTARDAYGDTDPVEEKRSKLPVLASVVLEAVKIQNLCSTLEPFLRQVIGEEVERVLGRIIPKKLESRTPTLQIQEPCSSDLRLIFRNKVSLPLFTGGKVEGDQGLPICVVLEDVSTGRVVKTGPESMAKLEVVVLDGDFANDYIWTAEDFEQHVLRERDGKRPLLTGDLSMTLKEGVGTLGELTFTDNSSWIRSRKFRLGVRVLPGYLEGIRIKECKTEAFTVKDHRGELYKKHYPPALADEVWRLDKIGKDGAFHKKLQRNGIKTVEDFLRNYMMDQQKLRNILGSGMSNKMWDGTVEHAKTCVLNRKVYVFNADNARNICVIFNNIYQLMGVTYSGHYKSAESLTENEKVHVHGLVKVAYANWHNVKECDSGSLATETTCKHMNMFIEEEGMRMIGSSSGLNKQPSRNCQTSHMPANTIAHAATFQHHDYNTEVTPKIGDQEHTINHNDQMLITVTDTQKFLLSNQPLQGSFTRNDAPLISLAIESPTTMLSRSYSFQYAATSQQAYQPNPVEWQRIPMTHGTHCIMEEDIRAMTQEMLGNDDMQKLLRSSYFPVPETFRLYEEEAYIPGYALSPTLSYGGNGRRSSGKAYVGWLKLKAALWWGIFIRKIVNDKAVKRAQIED